MSTIRLTVSQWKLIRKELLAEHPQSVLLLKSRMRSVLGFTVREHNEWVTMPNSRTVQINDQFALGQEDWYKDKQHEFSIRLDFYSERKYTMFLLKFSELISKA